MLDLAARRSGLPRLRQTFAAEPHFAAYVHGEDGLGEWASPCPEGNLRKHASQALICNEHPGEIDLIAIGPLTNPAMPSS